MLTTDVRATSAGAFDRLDVENLSVWFGAGAAPLVAVDGISFSVKRGEHLGIIGESGSGKTVTSLAALGFERGRPGIVGGSVRLNGRELLPSLHELYPRARSPEDRIRRKRRRWRVWSRELTSRMRNVRASTIGISFQDPTRMLDPLYTVEQHLSEAIALGHRGTATTKRDESLLWLDRLQLTEPEKVLTSYPHQLSGGMCQRVVLAMALAAKPGLLILDEPMSALDVTVGSRILLLLRELCGNEELTLLVISHNLAVVRELTSRAIVMYAGQIVESVGFGRGAVLDAKHPYTRGLLDSQVTEELIAGGGRLLTIPGELTRIDREAGGCRFASRCPVRAVRAEQGDTEFARRCRDEAPPSVTMNEATSAPDRAFCWDVHDRVGEHRGG
jgi:peptide/nickel transport system ATP-binding protein